MFVSVFLFSVLFWLLSCSWFSILVSHPAHTTVKVSSPVFLLLAGGFVCCVLGFLFLFLAFLISLILISRYSSFILASSCSCSYFLYSLSPSRVLSLGSEHRLYSLLELRILWEVFCWMMTDSSIWRSNDVLVYFTTSIPNFILVSCSPSCWSRACLSM